MIDKGKRNLLGVLVNAMDAEAAAACILQAAEKRQSLTVAPIAVQSLVTAVLDSEHKHRLNQMDLTVMDGQPLRWAMNALYKTSLPERVYGPTLMMTLCARCAEANLPIFLYGTDPPVLEILKECLLKRFPELRIAGMRAGYYRRLSPEEQADLCETINATGAALVFAGLGGKRQETWMYEQRQHLSIPLIGVGAAFDFHSGRVKQAPPWMQRRGLEWLFRIYQEPRRLWKRYLLLNPVYISLFLLQFLGLYSPNPAACSAPSEITGEG